MRAAAIALLVTACGSTSSLVESQPAQLGDLRFDAPDEWSHNEVREGSRLIARWLPSDNPNKAVVSVIRTELRADHRDATPDEIETMLADAQRSLPHAQIGARHALHTARGLDGFEVESEFVPPGERTSYHRIHAVLVDGPVKEQDVAMADNAGEQRLFVERAFDATTDSGTTIAVSIKVYFPEPHPRGSYGCQCVITIGEMVVESFERHGVDGVQALLLGIKRVGARAKVALAAAGLSYGPEYLREFELINHFFRLENVRFIDGSGR